jgi:DNA processing protein
VDAAQRIAAGLAANGVVVVSGLAVGIDAAAHRAALAAGGATAAVLGCGLDVRYPARNAGLKADIERQGTLLSEYPAGTQPDKFRFPERNRIIAGLCHGVVAVEGLVTSGALLTARIALDANRAVFAVPGSVRNVMAEGPNLLIKRCEAALVTSAEDVLDEMSWPVVEAGTGAQDDLPDLVPDQIAVLAVLDDRPLHPEDLAEMAGLTDGDFLRAVTHLEGWGLAHRTMGGCQITRQGSDVRASLAAAGALEG